uniref:Xylulose kinase-1 n=1 Tax=Tanacetum cinerariifolium TaxID=118510 RepID=A0A699IG15_TANCI|nr:hypothetical protein [Tanacetum cinerariifolium]
MVAILEKTEHNNDFHQIVDFLEASHIRYALTISPTIYVSHIRQFWSTARIETTDQETKIIATVDDEPASLSRDDRYGEAFITVSSLDVGQDRENIAKTSTMPHESSPRVPSLDADEGREELGADKSTEKGSNDIEDMVNVLSSMEAANILSSGGATISTASVSPTDIFLTTGVPTVSGSFPIVAREMEEEFARENQRLSKQAARDSKIARIHTEEELKLMIEGLDRNNEVISKHLSEYEQAEADLSVGEKIELISELVKYQDHLAEILKYQAQQSKPSPKKEEDLHQLWILVKETFSIRQCTRDKEKELWVELKRLFEPDSEDQIWTYHQAFMHDPLDWKLFDTCGVHHASTKNQEIFIIVENDYPLRKGLANVMIVQDEELFEESSPGLLGL